MDAGDRLGHDTIVSQLGALLTRWIHQLVANWHGAFEESVAAFEAAVAGSGRLAYPLMAAVTNYADWGKPAEARTRHEELTALSRETYVSNIIRAKSAAAVGEGDLAIDLARQACDEREPLLILVGLVLNP